MLNTTIATASTNARPSSQVMSEPQTFNAGTNSGCRYCSIASMATLFARRGDLHQDLVGLDHAELEARLLLDHFQAFLEVAHFGGQLLIACARGPVVGLLLVELRLQVHHVSHARFAEPKIGMHERDQRDEDQRDEAHDQPGSLAISAGCRTPRGPDSSPRRRGLLRCAAAGCTWRCGRCGSSSRS